MYVSRLSMHTGTYLHKNSCSATNHKVSAMPSLINRAYRICSTNEIFEKSFKLIENIFINNGYHFSFINKIKNKVIHRQNSTNSLETQRKKTIYLTLNNIKEHEKYTTLVANTVENIIGTETQVRVAYQTRKTQSFFAKNPSS